MGIILFYQRFVVMPNVRFRVFSNLYFLKDACYGNSP